ncbi:uncharacterized protein LOC143920841 [Arctopsyche grandis]|uniref:uncharacterized protein LOC143920841 n=1 Tax=Arctopsyche grandis TaxID=121162 RepID=UPI00406D8E24
MAKLLVTIILMSVFFNQTFSFSINRDFFEHEDDSSASSIEMKRYNNDIAYESHPNITNIINIANTTLQFLIPRLQNLRIVLVQILPQLRNNTKVTINGIQSAITLIRRAIQKVMISIVDCTEIHTTDDNWTKLMNKTMIHWSDCSTMEQDIHYIVSNAKYTTAQTVMVSKAVVEQIANCSNGNIFNMNCSCISTAMQSLQNPITDTARRIIQMGKDVNQALQTMPMRVAKCTYGVYMESGKGLAKMVGKIGICSAKVMSSIDSITS